MDYNAKIVMLKGADGADIKDISKTATKTLVDTYTITLSDGRKYIFNVTNGKAIKSVSKTATSGLTDTYTIAFNDGSTQTFNVTNGVGFKSIEKTATSGLTDTYTLTLTDGTTKAIPVTNGRGIKNISKTGSGGLVDTYTITYNDGTTSTFTVTNGMNAGGREVLRTLPNISIPKNADINTYEYLNIGSYFCGSYDVAQTISNIPVKTGFCMYVIAPLGGTYGSESSLMWGYRIRIFINIVGDIYIQVVRSAETAGVYTYDNWKRLITESI